MIGLNSSVSDVTKNKNKSEKKKMTNHIEARVVSFKQGLQILSNVNLVRINSKAYTLLIMVDYLPTLGEIDGDVTFVLETEEISFNKIKGYYVNRSNVFSLMIDEEQEEEDEE